MVTTRSKTVQDFVPTKKAPPGRVARSGRNENMSPAKANVSKKRKPSNIQSDVKSASKKSKIGPTSNSMDEIGDGILINRAPVLQLWSACVTQFLYPELEWTTCLSAGSAISTICAISKGRSIGTVPDKDESKDKEKKREDAKNKQKELENLEVMQFKLNVKDGLVLVGSEKKGKPGNEELLKKKFGPQDYEQVKKTFEETLQKWEGKESALNDKAFGFYEEFRPTVNSGSKGWGRKGELSLDKIQKTIS